LETFEPGETMKHGIWAAVGMAMAMTVGTGLGLSGCATETQTDRNKLEFGSNSSALQVGDTSGLWKVSRTIIEANGRENKDDTYTFFHLVSSDTTVASVIRNQQLVGRKPGEVSVKALDDKSKLETETSIKVTVTAKP
jgi:hypothetical protein